MLHPGLHRQLQYSWQFLRKHVFIEARDTDTLIIVVVKVHKPEAFPKTTSLARNAGLVLSEQTTMSRQSYFNRVLEFGFTPDITLPCTTLDNIFIQSGNRRTLREDDQVLVQECRHLITGVLRV